MPKKKRPVGRPKLPKGTRGVYQLTLYKYFDFKENSHDKKN